MRYSGFEAHVECGSLENLKERLKSLFPRLRTVLVFSGYVVSVKSSLSSGERQWLHKSQMFMCSKNGVEFLSRPQNEGRLVFWDLKRRKFSALKTAAV